MSESERGREGRECYPRVGWSVCAVGPVDQDRLDASGRLHPHTQKTRCPFPHPPPRPPSHPPKPKHNHHVRHPCPLHLDLRGLRSPGRRPGRPRRRGRPPGCRQEGTEEIKNERVAHFSLGGARRAPRRAREALTQPPRVWPATPSTDLVDWKVDWAPPRAGRAGARGGAAEVTALEKGDGGAAPSSFPRSTRPAPPPRPARTRPDRVVGDLGCAVGGCSGWM